ncbi:MAG: ATP-binding protein [Veillonellales bacterium]
MFYKLRLKLTLINVAVIFLLFSLLISGTYYFSHIEINRHSEMLAKKIMSDILAGNIHDLPVSHELEHPGFEPPNNPPPHSPLAPPLPTPFHSFFVKTSFGGDVVFQSTNPPLSGENLAMLIKMVLQNNKNSGFCQIAGSDFYFLKALQPSSAEVVMVFQDFAQENKMLDIQLTVLMVIGFVCLILSFFGSFFIANHALTPIQAAWQQQKDFLSDASHELRTPLAVIQTNLDIVLDNKSEPVASQCHWLQNVQEEVTQMTTLVNSLLFLARADAHHQLIQRQPFLLTDAITCTLLPFKPVADNKGISLNFEPSAPLSYNGDEGRIKQVIGILLDNAIRHTPEGGTISLTLLETSTDIMLIVADSGEGIPAEMLDKIFCRFYQVDKARSVGGAGLGLAIAKWIIEEHGGFIGVVSTLEVGSTFTIKLPKR